MTNRLAIAFRCRKCEGCHENLEDRKEKLHYDVSTVTDFSYLGDRIDSGGGCEEAVACKIQGLP